MLRKLLCCHCAYSDCADKDRLKLHCFDFTKTCLVVSCLVDIHIPPAGLDTTRRAVTHDKCLTVEPYCHVELTDSICLRLAVHNKSALSRGNGIWPIAVNFRRLYSSDVAKNVHELSIRDGCFGDDEWCCWMSGFFVVIGGFNCFCSQSFARVVTFIQFVLICTVYFTSFCLYIWLRSPKFLNRLCCNVFCVGVLCYYKYFFEDVKVCRLVFILMLTACAQISSEQQFARVACYVAWLRLWECYQQLIKGILQVNQQTTLWL